MSEQVQEATVKAFKKAQVTNSRLMSPEQNMIDIFNHLTLRSDPYLTVQYGSTNLQKPKSVKYSETHALLQESEASPETVSVLEEIIMDENEVTTAEEEPSLLNRVSFRDLALAWEREGSLSDFILLNWI